MRQVMYRTTRPRVTMADTTSTEWFETKCEAWAYERECRLLRVLRDAETQLEAVPQPIFLFDFPNDAVAEIIVGLRSPPSLQDRLKVLATHFPKAKLLVAREHPKDYALKIEAL